MLTTENLAKEGGEIMAANWGDDTPRGGKAVMNRILKEKATVPLFFAQTLVQSLRDVGYNHTTSALCEHVDNAIQAKASEIRVFFRQSGKKGEYQMDAAVYDNGAGPHVCVQILYHDVQNKPPVAAVVFVARCSGTEINLRGKLILVA